MNRIIDAHSHLWLKQDTMVDGLAVKTLEGNSSRSMFLGEERQMLPPFMTDGRNTAEIFISNMNYAQVSAAVVVQEVIDGCQDEYLKEVQSHYPDRFLCCGLATDACSINNLAAKNESRLLPFQDIVSLFHSLHQKWSKHSRLWNARA